MADLNRLRTIATTRGDSVNLIAAVLHHCAPDPTSQKPLDVDLTRSLLDWMAAAPMPFFGPVLGSIGVTHDEFSVLLSSLPAGSIPDLVSLSSAFCLTPGDWDRATRNATVAETVGHGRDATKLPSQTGAEFAVLDALSSLGYPSVEAAVAALADFRRVNKRNTLVVHHRQDQRSRHCVAFRVHTGHRWRFVITPWCVSRSNALAYVMALLTDDRRGQVEERTARRAETVMNYTARRGLEALRDLTVPAVALLTTYKYEPSLLSFVDDRGRIVQSVQARLLYVWVAFAGVFMTGTGDVLLSIARQRVELAQSLDYPDAPPSLSEYFSSATEDITALLLYSRYLQHRAESRDASRFGPRLNKGPMLSYIVRARTKAERNTLACINRMQEVTALVRSLPVVPKGFCLVVEWGGDIDQSAVLASAAVAGVDIALDVGESGIDVPGGDVNGDEETSRSYQLYLASAKARKPPLRPIIEYGSGDPLISRFESISRYLAVSGNNAPLVYISGGVVADGNLPVFICSEASTRLNAVALSRGTVPIPYACAEVLRPPMCPHGAQSNLDNYLAKSAYVETECDYCGTLYRCVSSVVSPIADHRARLVKPRSAFAHNGHFSLELVDVPDPDGHSMETMDAAIASNVLRNATWGDEPVSITQGADPISPRLSDAVKNIVTNAYRMLSSGYTGKLGDSDAMTIAASVV
nr:hypothetical protein [Talaromyces amestolkiae polymycovirus 1]